jgi:hypothetical protein
MGDGRRYVVWLLGATVFSLALSLGAVELWASFLRVEPASFLGYRALVIVNSIALAAPLVVVILGIRYSLFPQRRHLTVYVLSAYCSIVVSFAGIYYDFSCRGDFDDAVNQYLYYSRRSALDQDRQAPLTDARAFRGIEGRLWTDVSSTIETASSPEDSTARRLPSGKTFDEVVQFQRHARILVFLDCLHFSVTTMTAVGLGDITPRTPPVKAFVDAQILTAVVLVSIALQKSLGSAPQ